MKKVILAAVTFISVVLSGNAFAQTATASDQVTVNIKLKPIHTLVVNSGQKNVDLTYSTKLHYSGGVEAPQADHLEIFSTGAFEVKVKTDGDFKSGSESILASSVKVTSSAGTINPIPGSPTYSQDMKLSASDQSFIKSTTGGRDMKVNVNYKGAGGDDYLNKFSKNRGAAENVFVAQVTYTILAD